MEDSKTFSIKGLVLRPVKSLTGPCFQCQYCDEFIDQAPTAIIVWDPDGTEGLVVHKQCDLRAKAEGRELAYSADLDLELADLLHNSGMTKDVLEKAMERSRQGDSF